MKRNIQLSHDIQEKTGSMCIHYLDSEVTELLSNKYDLKRITKQKKQYLFSSESRAFLLSYVYIFSCRPSYCIIVTYSLTAFVYLRINY